MPRVTVRLLALLASGSLPAALAAQVPANVPESHTVKQGDTLWDLAAQYFGDPLQWPRIYQLNTDVVEDPHWIYPGEVLRLRSDVAVQAVPAETTQVVVAAGPDTAAADTMQREAAVTPAAEAAVVEEEPADTTPIFPRPGVVAAAPVIQAEFNDNYRAVTRAEFYQSGFLTEGKTLPWGKVQGPIAPPQVAARSTQSAMIYGRVALEPPAAGAYQVGDTLLAAQLDPRAVAGGYGQIVHALGLVRVDDVSGRQPLGTVIALYGEISPGTLLLPAEKYAALRGVRAEPVADGTEGAIVAFRGNDVLRGIGDGVFIDQGRNDGMRIGDVLEVRRTVAPRQQMAAMVPEVTARLQVTHLGDRTATARVVWVAYPDIPVGTRWKVIRRLPG
ncbi:MAG TPA: LysM peptidoglycan-binding domain-containing protein [Gemmatimonadales bacterium]|nr:LysM peptidoglycan-binding domain-containing protein [Gemmatimonadales bacterium]